MKPFVGEDSGAIDSLGGRLRGASDLGSLVVMLAGTVVLAELLGLIETGPLLKFLLPGLAFGAVVGKMLVVWREWGGNELPPERVRQIETAWTLAGTAISLLLYSFA